MANIKATIYFLHLWIEKYQNQCDPTYAVPVDKKLCVQLLGL